jgi:hypothetical protein
MTGYSGTPLWKKLGDREGMTACTDGAPEGYAAMACSPAGDFRGLGGTRERANLPGPYLCFIEIRTENEAAILSQGDCSRWGDLGFLAEEELGGCHRHHRRCGTAGRVTFGPGRHKGMCGR